MANRNEYVVQLTVDKSGAITGAEEFNSSLKGVDKSVTSLRSQLREMQKELSTLDPNTQAFRDLAAKAGEVKDKMNDAAEAVNANAGPAFESLGNNFGLLKGRLANLDFEGVGQSLKGIAGNIGNIKFGDVTNGIKAMGSAFASLGKALLTNPFFLLAGVLVGIVLNFDKIKNAIDLGVNPATRELVKTTDAARAASDEAAKSYDLEERRLRALGVAEEEIAAGRKKRTQAQLQDAKAQAEAQKKLLGEQIAADAISKGLSGTGAAGSIASLFAPSDEEIAATKEQLKKLSDEIQLYDVQLLEIDKREKDRQKTNAVETFKNLDDIAAKNREKNDKIKADNEKALQDEIALRAAAAKAAEDVFVLQQQIQKQINDDRAKEQASFIQRRSEDELKAIADQEQLKMDLLKEGQDKEILQVDQKYIALRELAHGNAELLKELAEQNGAEVIAINEKYNAQDLANKRATEEAKINLASQVIGSLGSIVDSFTAKSKKQAKAQFEITKGLNIAQAILNTYAAANSALATTPGGPIAKGIAVGAVIATGLANVNKIRKTKFEDTSSSADTSSSGSGGGAASSVGTPQGNGVPTFSPLDTNFITNRPDQVQPAYVIAGQAATALEAREKIERQSRL